MKIQIKTEVYTLFEKKEHVWIKTSGAFVDFRYKCKAGHLKDCENLDLIGKKIECICKVVKRNGWLENESSPQNAIEKRETKRKYTHRMCYLF